MKRIAIGFLLAGLAALAWPRAGHAQADNWELNLHGGAYRYDLDEDGSDDTDVLVGARLFRNWDIGLSLGGNFDWVFADQIPLPAGSEHEDINVNLLLYSLELEYTFPTHSRGQFFVGAGFGGQTLTYGDLPADSPLKDSYTDPLVPLTVGFKVVNDATDPRWGFRVDARDNGVLRTVTDPVEGDEDTSWENNFELSGGISFFFGGGPPAYEQEEEPIVERPRDGDADGVPDSLDQCPNTPAGTRVDANGCPVPVDSDRDGVNDDVDQCPNTPAGTQVDETGCPVVPKAACADGRDWYRQDASISVEGNEWVKFGTSRTFAEGELQRIGEYDGVPVYARASAREPYRELVLPLCAPANTYQVYHPVRNVRGTTG